VGLPSGKEKWRSLKTKVFGVAKSRLAGFEGRRKMEKGRRKKEEGAE